MSIQRDHTATTVAALFTLAAIAIAALILTTPAEASPPPRAPAWGLHERPVPWLLAAHQIDPQRK